MDTLKEMAIEEGTVKEKNVELFHKNFLNSVRTFGRTHEISMMGLYKLKSGDLMSDLDVGMGMILKGKMPLLPHMVKDKGKVKDIFNKTVQ